MTEEEAKTKWCPHVRYKSSRGEGINRWQEGMDAQYNPDHSRCIGSACMAWRWRVMPGPLEVGVHATTNNPGDGYCGLAGKP
jgi:hypothetical protein